MQSGEIQVFRNKLGQCIALVGLHEFAIMPITELPVEDIQIKAANGSDGKGAK